MQMPFRAPTDYYCEALAPIDEQICALLAKRKELSQNKPGYPQLERISIWSQQYGLREDFVRMLFASFYHESSFLPRVEPIEFVKFVPILKSVGVDGVLYAVTHMKQYSNASVVNIETVIQKDETNDRFVPPQIELTISSEYSCRSDAGFVHNKGLQHSYVVIPPLPDDISGVEFCLNIKPQPYHQIPDRRVLVEKEFTVTIK